MASPAQPASFDGTYYPPAGGASAPRCGTKITAPLRVNDGTASLQLVSAGLMQGPVAPDGSLAIHSGRNELMGKFSGNHFAGTLAVQSCRFDMQYDKRS